MKLSTTTRPHKHTVHGNEQWHIMIHPHYWRMRKSECEFESDKLESVSALLPPVPVSVSPFPCATSVVCASALSEVAACLSSLKNASTGRLEPVRSQNRHFMLTHHGQSHGRGHYEHYAIYYHHQYLIQSCDAVDQNNGVYGIATSVQLMPVCM